MRSDIPWPRFVEQALVSHSLLFGIIRPVTYALRHRTDYDEQKAVAVVSASLPGLPIEREKCHSDVRLRGRAWQLLSFVSF